MQIIFVFCYQDTGEPCDDELDHIDSDSSSEDSGSNNLDLSSQYEDEQQQNSEPVVNINGVIKHALWHCVVGFSHNSHSSVSWA